MRISCLWRNYVNLASKPNFRALVKEAVAAMCLVFLNRREIVKLLEA